MDLERGPCSPRQLMDSMSEKGSVTRSGPFPQYNAAGHHHNAAAHHHSASGYHMEPIPEKGTNATGVSPLGTKVGDASVFCDESTETTYVSPCSTEDNHCSNTFSSNRVQIFSEEPREHRLSNTELSGSDRFSNEDEEVPPLRSSATAHRNSIDETKQRPGRKMLSAASAMFDREGKGYLDPTERALRNLDDDNDGRLTIHNVYDLMYQLTESQRMTNELMTNLREEKKTAMGLKKAVGGLIVFALLLSLANIASSFAAAKLAKDTTISSTGIMQDKATNAMVGTSSKVSEVQMLPLTEKDRRRLAGLDFCTSITVNQATNDTTRSCSEQGKIYYQDALDQYHQFCPSYEGPGSGPCSSMSGGVDRLQLVCNGRGNVIYGGDSFPLQGVVLMENPGYGEVAIFPANPASQEQGVPFAYQGEQRVRNSNGRICTQAFQMNIFCPMDWEEECIVIASIDGSTACEYFRDSANPLNLCGPVRAGMVEN